MNATPDTPQNPRQSHWEGVYAKKAPDTVSWYRPRLDRSLAFIDALGLPPAAHLADIGGGASTLVDDLLGRGFSHISVADISARALDLVRERLGPRAEAVRWVVGDVTRPLFADGSVDLWHDRAVFHFLTDVADRAAYAENVRRAVAPGGHAIVATFAPGGPERCSGLPVRRHSPAEIAEALGPAFTPVAEAEEVHLTPSGAPQAFAWAVLRRDDGPV